MSAASRVWICLNFQTKLGTCSGSGEVRRVTVSPQHGDAMPNIT